MLNIQLFQPQNLETKEIYTHFQVGTGTRVEGGTQTTQKCCSIHPELPPFYVCTICENLFCKICTLPDEGDKKVCLFCGGMCVLYLRLNSSIEANKQPESSYQLVHEQVFKVIEPEITYAKLVTADFFAALIYPFKFPFSLIIGGFLFSILVLGLIITTFRWDWTWWVTFVFISFIIMLKFGALSKTFESFLQGDFKQSFMPRLHKFTIGEEFINPFITGLGGCLVSFGLFFVISFGLGFYAWFSFTNDLNKVEAEMRQSGSNLNSTINSTASANPIKAVNEHELRALINQTRLRQLESVFGNNHLVDDKQLEKLAKSILRLTIFFQVPVFLAFILGILYFPAICLTIGQAHSASWRRFTIGFQAMRNLGFDYIKILLLSFVFFAVSIAAIKGLDLTFSNLDLPIAGVFSAIIVGSFLIFYFWTAFSSILAITACKKV